MNPRILMTSLWTLALATFWCGAARADQIVYDDALASGWENWSYFGNIGVDFANAVPVQSGSASIATTFNMADAALSLRISPALDGTAYESLSFWAYGAAGSGTELNVFLQETDGGAAVLVHQITAPAGVWTFFDVPMASLGSPTNIARINFQDNANADVGATFYIDNLVLVEPGAPSTPIFADGFESGDTCAWSIQGCSPTEFQPPITLTSGTTTVGGNNLASRTVVWNDDGNEPREAVMIDQRPAGAGYLRRLTYRVGGVDRVCTGVDGGPIQGFGYVTNHLGDPGDFGGAWGNWSPGVAGTTSVPLAGQHHVIIQYSMPTFPLGGRTIPTTVAWFFATGRSHPIWTVSQDARAHPQGNLGGDARSPYGEMAFAGDIDNGRRIAGVSWGDTYKFFTVVNNTTQESTLLENSSGWRYNQTNTIPYVLAWTEIVDAEQGSVATLPISLQDQGSDSREFPQTGFGKNQQDLNGPLPRDDDWAYQLMNYPEPPNGGTTNKKMAWGTNAGALGGFDNYCDMCGFNLAEFSRHRDSTTPFTGTRENGLLLAYSTFVVFGPHAGSYLTGSTGQTVREMENVQLATLSAAVGSVRTQGPRGVGSAANATITYQPAGYNPIYATWEVNSSANASTMTLTPANGAPLSNPIFVLHGYTSASPPNAVSLNGVPGVSGADYLVSVDTTNQRLWLTIMRTVQAALQVQVTP